MKKFIQKYLGIDMLMKEVRYLINKVLQIERNLNNGVYEKK